MCARWWVKMIWLHVCVQVTEPKEAAGRHGIFFGRQLCLASQRLQQPKGCHLVIFPRCHIL